MLSLLLLCTITFATDAQEQYGTIKGQVVDRDNGQPLPFVAVRLKNYADSIIIGANTNFDGEYEISQIPLGNYQYKVAYAGYKTIIEENINIFKDSIVHINKKLTTLSDTIDVVVMPYICFKKNK